jgi:hypothetical protein
VSRTRLLVVVALALLVAGFLNLARGLSHPGSDYRVWALHHGSYSDLLALSGDRYLGGHHPFPYVSDRIEYPVILGLLLWLPSYAPGGQFGFFLASSLLLAAFLVASILLLITIPGANPWLLAATPALATYGLLNWDLVGIAFLVGGIAWFERSGRSGALLGAGVATKLFPAAAFPAFVRSVRGRRRWQWMAAAGLAVAVINVPFAIVAFDNWRWFFTFNRQRPPDFAVWNAIHVTSVPVVNALSLACVAAAALFAWRYGTHPRAARLGTALVIAVWMTVNKVSSPQYSLWVFAAAAMVGAPWPIFGALVAASMFDFSLELWLLPHHGLTLAPAVTVMVAARTAATLWFAWWCARRLRVEVAGDEIAERSGGVARDGAGLADGLDLAR